MKDYEERRRRIKERLRRSSRNNKAGAGTEAAVMATAAIMAEIGSSNGSRNLRRRGRKESSFSVP